ncbi:expressed unknown protein [Seminavis robusta]|uniref:Uncharacterized protein n=1 Tax=Seminavis robusta TaxID=568900 RepID=A0A9N8D8M8_9STRA|nr:expressed unknown protein [Seminavis robusta]|eukprot:Sro3_g002190.1 n/a (296) ;mRNA; r:80802-81689
MTASAVTTSTSPSTSTSTSTSTCTDTEERRIVGLNNLGIRQLQSGNSNGSRQALQSLLQSLHHLKQAKNMNTPACQPDQPDQVDQEGLERPSLFALQPIHPTNDSASFSSSSTDNLPFQMFDHVFAFSHSTSTSSVTSMENRDGTMAALTYNLAATHHSRGVYLLAHNKSAKVSLSKAIQLYTFALSAMQHWAKNFQVHQGCHILRLAILNNMAHANALLQHKQDAIHCLKCLRDVLPYAKLPLVSKEHYAFFSANVVVLCLKQVVQHQHKHKRHSQEESQPSRDTLLDIPAPAA